MGFKSFLGIPGVIRLEMVFLAKKEEKGRSSWWARGNSTGQSPKEDERSGEGQE